MTMISKVLQVTIIIITIIVAIMILIILILPKLVITKNNKELKTNESIN